jgi:hypothetical protein
MEKERQPHWSLAEIRGLAARERLVLTHAACDYFSTRSEALDWIHGVIAELRVADFAHSVELEVHTADVYGVVVDGCGWYLKLTLEMDAHEKLVLVISCHPVEYSLVTRGGTIEP